MPTFPLATLSAKVTATGISAPTYSDILQSLIASYQTIYGSDVLLTPDTQDLQLLAVFAQAIADQNNTIIAVYNGFLPSFAQGAGLSALVKINGLSRNVASNSTAIVTVVGVAGTEIVSGIVQDANGNLWDLLADFTIPGSGTIDVLAVAQVQGAIQAPAHSINQIFTPTRGWQTADNANSATVGAPVENDAALRVRQVASTALPAQTPLGAILAAVANIAGVSRYAIYENNGNNPDINGVPGHSIAVIALGGDPVAIATAISEKKSPGTGTYGTTTEIIIDQVGLPITIRFFQLVLTPIFVSVTIKALDGFVGSTVDAIKAAIVSFINGLPIGEDVRYNWIVAAAALTGSTEITFFVSGLTMGVAPAPVGTADIPIVFNAAANCVVGNINVTVT